MRWYWFSIIGNIVKDHDVRLVLVTFIQKIFDLHNRVVVSYAGIDYLGAGSPRGVKAFNALGKSLLERHAPTLREGIAQHQYAPRRAGTIVRNFTVAQPFGTDLDVDAHQVLLAIGPVCVTDQRIVADNLDVAGVFPHFEI